ncbi:TraB/GumN family protein [Rhizobium sp. YS-1r]|uniref:TraB/GumN family protein n=1 Tax=Rhizobium sp. YS-1r TaxID=1532558 RepID=UPI00050FFBD5|nr:TraB/GumN family protein [Rhizobium sp. YS-1r]KGD87548.1 polysaccharide biosynthesis protein GumN [Rhizobium sp. YS-1r]
MTTPAFASPAGAFFRRAQSLTLWLIAAAHLIALVSLLLVLGSLSPAQAQTPVCHGVNLLDEMKVENPTAYQQLVTETDKVPNGRGIFWKIGKEGVATSYLLGTMHVSDPRVLKMPPGAADAQAKSSTIVIESDEILDEKKAMAGILAKPELTMFTDGSSIEKLLPKEDVALLEAGLKQRGIPLSAVSRMKPWMLMAFVSLPACEMARKAANPDFLDKRIALDAVAAGKPVKGLETFVEQLSAMAAIPVEFHLKSLVETVRLGPKMDDVFETMTELYLSGDIGLIMPLLKTIAPEGDDDAGYAEFEKLVVTKRNHVMADRAAPILAEGGAFIAVGALHLPGEEGLVELLRRQGFAVTRAD